MPVKLQERKVLSFDTSTSIPQRKEMLGQMLSIYSREKNPHKVNQRKQWAVAMGHLLEETEE